MIIAARGPAASPDIPNANSNAPQQNNADRGHFDDVLATVGNNAGSAPDRRPARDANNKAGDAHPPRSAAASDARQGGASDLADMLSRATAATPSVAATALGTGAASPDDASAAKKPADPDATAVTGTPAGAPNALLDVLGAALGLSLAAPAAGAPAGRDDGKAKRGDLDGRLAQDEAAAGAPLPGVLPGALEGTAGAGAIAVSHIAVTSQIAPHMPTPGQPGLAATPTNAAVTPPTGPGPSGAAPGAKASVDTVAPPAAEIAKPAETSAQPALPATPVTASVARAVISLAAADGAAAAPSASAPEPNTPAPARTLTLQLSPSNLGTVAIRLHVTGSSLDLDMTVSDPQTLGLISREHDILANALRDGNYDVTSLVIQGAPSAEPTANNDARSQNFGSRKDQPDDDRSQFGGNANQEDGSAASRRGRDGERPARPGSSGAGNGGSLFI